MNNRAKRTLFHYLPVYGCISTGLCYTGVGTIAMLSLLKVRKGGADESSMLAILNDVLIGKLLLWIIMVGTACYIVWRIFEAVTDPYGYGKDFKGLGKRSGIALSTFADLLIVYAAIKVLLGIGDIQQSGEPKEERAFVDGMLAETWGAAAVTAMGVVVLLAAVVQFVYGVTRGYKERLDIDHYSKAAKTAIHFLAWTGYCSRGIIVGITGFFLLKAAFTGAAKHVVNTDKAFDFIGDELGYVPFVLIAVGTVCYGVYMIINGIAYDQDKD
ncbi:MAG TPA: DUF1206 domain-containing protein [Ohtaekwangia sp.]|nr:DUF1206 domain-containing protein [Ohtaekwangia sp.]